MSPNAWAVKAGVSRTVWTDMRKHGNPSRRTLEKLLSAAGSSLLEFEALRVEPERRQSAQGSAPHRFGDQRAIWNPRALPPLPLIASGLGGEWGDAGSQVELTEIRRGELLDRVHRPPSLAGDPEAFALTMVGRAMWPRFKTGARIAVSPRSPKANTAESDHHNARRSSLPRKYAATEPSAKTARQAATKRPSRCPPTR